MNITNTDRISSGSAVPPVDEPVSVYSTGEPTMGQLITSLSEDFSSLVRKEIKLAKVETMETVSEASRNLVMLAAGGLVAYAGFLALLGGLAVLIGAAIDNYWLAALLVGLVVLGIGAILLSSGRAGLKRVSLAPEKTIETLKDDARWVKEQVS
jgi:uncharacterized membrane protein YqjE